MEPHGRQEQHVARLELEALARRRAEERIGGVECRLARVVEVGKVHDFRRRALEIEAVGVVRRPQPHALGARDLAQNVVHHVVVRPESHAARADAQHARKVRVASHELGHEARQLKVLGDLGEGVPQVRRVLASVLAERAQVQVLGGTARRRPVAESALHELRHGHDGVGEVLAHKVELGLASDVNRHALAAALSREVLGTPGRTSRAERVALDDHRLSLLENLEKASLRQ